MSKVKSRKSSVESSASAAEARSVEELAADITLSGVMELCARLSLKNKSVIKAYIESLLVKEETAHERLLELEKRLIEQKAANLELSERVSSLEKVVATKVSTKKITFAEQAAKESTHVASKAELAAKRPAKVEPKSFKDLTAYIRTRPEKQSEKIVKIRTPDNGEEPMSYLTRTYSPGDDGIKVKYARPTRDGKSVIVRLNSEVEAAAMMEVPVLQECVISKVDYRYPKLMIFGATSDNCETVAFKLCEQNKVVRRFADGDFQNIADELLPIRRWQGRVRGTFTWIVEASPEVRRLLVDEMKGVAHMDWKSVRIVDYVGAIRCFKCQSYGHKAKFCQNKKGVCGHCAEAGHSFRECPASQGPARCAPCKSRKLSHDHSVKSRACPSFIEAAKREINRTDY